MPAADGWQVHTLRLTGEYGEPAWVLTGVEFAGTPGADIWELSLTPAT